MERKHYYCDICGRLLDEFEYYRTNNTEKYPTGRMTTCKKCVTLHLINWKPETFLPILEEIDVPYIEEEWNSILERTYLNVRNITPMTVLSKYLSKMRLRGFRDYRWSDTEWLKIERNRNREAIPDGNR